METPLLKRRRLTHDNSPISYEETNVYTTIKLENLDARNRYIRNNSSMTEFVDYNWKESNHDKPVEITRYNQIYKYAYIYERNNKYFIKRLPYKFNLSGKSTEDDDGFIMKDSKEKIQKFSFVGDVVRIVHPTKPFITSRVDVYLQLCVQRCGISNNRFF